MLTNLTYKDLETALNASSVYEYEDTSYRVMFTKDIRLQNSELIYTCTIFYNSHVVWSCGYYTSLQTLVDDFLTKGNKVFLEAHPSEG